MATVAPEKKVVRRQVFNFDTFSKLSLAKSYVVPQGFKSYEDLVAGLGNDTNKILELANAGLLSQAADQAKDSNEGWTIAEKNLPSNTPYNGDFINAANVFAMARSLAMYVFGMTPEMDKETKKAKKLQAFNMIKNSPDMVKGLKEQAAAADSEEDDEE